MASNRFVIVAIFAVIVLSTIAMATEYIVGDENGWTNDGSVDYEAWAKGKMFNVGDLLVFKYDATKHNVVKVNGSAFKDCLNPPGANVSTSGNDIITLKTAGSKWYLCGKPNHCNQGQKLNITVMDMSAPEPSPNTSGIISSGLFQAFTALFALFMAFN